MSAENSSASGAANWLLYGANGYTGELIAREAVRRGHRPILAGRNKTQIQALAKELNCPSRVFGLDDQTATLVALEDVAAVLNCAGPFSQTAGLMMQACLVSHVHYIDITGEIAVFELASELSEKAVRARSVLCPGAGFDVVPTDCMAASLLAALPDATHLALAFATQSTSSIGTTKTTLEMLGSGGKIRKDGKIVTVPFAYRTRQVDLGEGVRDVMCIPWGDVSTAYHTTGIPNVEVYVSAPPEATQRMKTADKWRGVLSNGFVQWLLKKQVSRGPRGPSQTERECNPTLVWGEVTNAVHERKVGRIRTANGYALTIQSALAILERLLPERELSGFITPAKLMGANFVESLPGSSPLRIEAA